jgi:hypothetical protein
MRPVSDGCRAQEPRNAPVTRSFFELPDLLRSPATMGIGVGIQNSVPL